MVRDTHPPPFFPVIKHSSSAPGINKTLPLAPPSALEKKKARRIYSKCSAHTLLFRLISRARSVSSCLNTDAKSARVKGTTRNVIAPKFGSPRCD